MKARGLSHRAAAEAAGLGTEYVRDIVRGKIRQPSALKLSQLAAALGTTAGYLMGIDPPLASSKPLSADLVGVRQADFRQILSIESTSDLFRYMYQYLKSIMLDKLLESLPYADERDREHLNPVLSTLAHLLHGLGLVTKVDRDFCLDVEDVHVDIFTVPEQEAEEQAVIHLATMVDGLESSDPAILRMALALRFSATVIAILQSRFDAVVHMKAVAEQLENEIASRDARGVPREGLDTPQ